MALVGMGVEPGFSDVAARYAADHLFSRIDEIGVRDGADLVVDGYDFAPTFSIWTTIEECLNPPMIYEREPRLVHDRPFSEPEIFTFPEGIGAAQVRQRRARRGDPDPALDRRRAGHVQVRTRRRVHQRAQDAPQARPRRRPPGRGARRARCRPATSSPPCCPTRPSSATRCTGRTCAGTWVKGIGKDGAPREVYVYHIVDNAWSMKEFGHQAVVWQTAVMPAVAIELMATGQWIDAWRGRPGGTAVRAVPRPARPARDGVGLRRVLGEAAGTGARGGLHVRIALGRQPQTFSGRLGGWRRPACGRVNR